MSIFKMAQLICYLVFFSASSLAGVITAVDVVKSNPSAGEYELAVTNNTDSLFIYAFAVAENEATSANGDTGTHGWWDAGVIREAQWDFGVGALGSIASPLGLSTLPDFETAFGSEFDRAVVYWLSAFENPSAPLPIVELMVIDSLESDEPDDASPIGPGETASIFSFTAPDAGSPCLVLMSNKSSVPANNNSSVPLQLSLVNCNTVAASTPGGGTSVPVPAGLPLLLSGLLGLLVIRRKAVMPG